MKIGAINWKALLWKLALPVGLLALGMNGMIDVGLQRDMAAKTVQLDTQVAAAKTLSGQLSQGLTGLSQLQQTTVQMQSDLLDVAQATSNMATGLQTLANTVAGIRSAVLQIGASTKVSSAELTTTWQAAESALANLRSIHSVNSQVVSTLSSMLSSEDAINQSLHQMNQKTALVP